MVTRPRLHWEPAPGDRHVLFAGKRPVAIVLPIGGNKPSLSWGWLDCKSPHGARTATLAEALDEAEGWVRAQFGLKSPQGGK